MSDQIRTQAKFNIVCKLPFGEPCEHHNCCHFEIHPNDQYQKHHIVFCEHAKPSQSHIPCKEIE